MTARRYDSYKPYKVYINNYYQTTLEEAIEENNRKLLDWEVKHRELKCTYKTKTTKAGRMLEVEIYPSFLNRQDYSRAKKEQRTSAAQQKQNDKNAQRKFTRYVHSNFEKGDIFLTGTYPDHKQPASEEECYKDLSNFIARLRYNAGRAGVESIRYMYVVESKVKADGRVHFHVHILLGREAGANIHGIDARDWIESKWTGGDYCNTKSLQWKRGGGFTGISKYFTKQFEELHEMDKPNRRRWGQSLGLKKWTRKPTESYSRFSKRRVTSLVKRPATLKEEFEKEYPDYEYIEDYPCEIRYSEVIDGFYLYCRMYKRE